MTPLQFLADSVGSTVVHVDEPRGLVCVWYGSTSFLEYTVDGGEVTHGSAWSTSFTPFGVLDAVAVARKHYGLSRD